ncbi:hypothetical protein MNR01_05915 [Lysobacter sp. S4-A87]|uniref:hypothetical protein n=1 Tax=Lysobacter sp. S4-A87 TaxID=2925843 RepID=UPI001F535520|nr:hypothetical protein [Lysobacter sp. S4-A87]UNK50541.1 hypothetical protein MNR01_05915 [Lysobacter sp. S4-A87]
MRRRNALLIALVVALLLLVLALRWVGQPSRVAGLILSEAGKSLGLEITAAGASEYRLRGTPMLLLRDVVARQPGAATPLLRAERIQLELPWATIRAAGNDLTVRRIELDAPQLDIAALQRWQATRPPSKPRIPTLTEGLRLVRGRVIGDGWSIDALDIDLPALYPQRSLSAQVRGRFVSDTLAGPFDLEAALTRPAANAGLGLSGSVGVESPPWSLPMRLTLSGLVHDGVDGMGVDIIRLGAVARYRNGETELPFVFGLAGPLRMHSGEVGMSPLGFALRGRDAIPSLHAHGGFSFGDLLTLRLDGLIADWPKAWPALPEPMESSVSALPFKYEYRGRPDLSDTSAMQLQRDATRFDASFRLPEVLAWIDAIDQGTPLPPLAGHLSTPRLEIAGATLEGVEVDITPALGEAMSP